MGGGTEFGGATDGTTAYHSASGGTSNTEAAQSATGGVYTGGAATSELYTGGSAAGGVATAAAIASSTISGSNGGGAAAGSASSGGGSIGGSTTRGVSTATAATSGASIGGNATGGAVTGTAASGGLFTGGAATGGIGTRLPVTGGIGSGGVSSSEPNAKSNGAHCTVSTECQSTYCVDGVCCESACQGQCETCNSGNGPGQCTKLLGQPNTNRNGCKNPGTVCGGSCTGETDCTYAGDQTPCDNQTECADATTRQLGMTCNGSGYCSVPVTKVCEGPMVCNVNTDQDCGTPKYTHVTVNEYNSCAVVSDGTLRCWGANDWGQLGLAKHAMASAPQRVPGKSNIKAVATGWAQTCVLLRDGSVNCWGADYNGNTGCPNPTMTFDPIDCATLPVSSQIVDLVSGAEQNCALTSSGHMKCWGRNDYGTIGDGTCGCGENVNPHAYSPVDVLGVSTATHITAGAWHTCAVMADGNIMCWGNNEHGQLGVGDLNVHTVPTTAIGIDIQKSGAMRIAASSEHTCALLSNGTLMCTGDNSSGQLGTSGAMSTVFAPTQPPITGMDLALGGGFTCVLTSPTSASCWGNGSRGSLGNGSFDDSATPVPVRLPAGIEFQSITSKSLHVCALSTQGRIWCWGANTSGQLGNGTTVDSAVPVEVQPATLN